jgi:opacity protein-like surface antigen
MRPINSWRLSAAVLMATASIGAYAAAASATATARPSHTAHAGAAKAGSPSVKRFNLSGYVINTDYSLGRNTGNTFQQTYKAATVIGVPIAGPYVGTKFPREDYVAMPIGNHELYVAWQDTKTHALLDVFVMDFATGVVFDYAPGSAHPESSGTVTVVHKGSHPLP